MANDGPAGPTRRFYEPSMLDAHPASAIAPMEPGLAAKVADSDFAPELIERLLAVRPDRSTIAEWIDAGFPTPAMTEGWVDNQERLLQSTLVARTATWADNDMLSDLCAHAPENVGDWTVTVERSPNPYAQYRLQEHCNVIVVEDRRVGLAMSASSVRNTYVEGQRTSVNMMSGWRVRDGFRGVGVSNLLRSAAGPGTNWFGLINYWYVRVDNASAGWIANIAEHMHDRPEGFAADTDRLAAAVFVLGADGETPARSTRVRPVTEADAERCIELINRTHAGLDLFRPYTADYLSQRLDDPNWGPKPSFFAAVYGWPQFHVIEAGGEIVACGGLWDRGRDIREIWQKDDQRNVHDPAALLDFGFAEGHDGDMAELTRHLVAEALDLGRHGMLAAFEFVPEVLEHLDDLKPIADVRELHVMPFTMPDLKIELAVSRPYTDLAYW